jgi:hypothetical protein
MAIAKVHQVGPGAIETHDRSSLFWASSDFETATGTTGGCIASDLSHLISVSPEALMDWFERVTGFREAGYN